MSLLTACQAVIKETGIGTAPGTIIGNTDPTAIQLNALAERSMKTLSHMSWEKMVREQTITTVASQEDYTIPTDWARYVSLTAWDATNYWAMRGSIDPQQWQWLKRGIVANTIRRRFRVMGGVLKVFPTPTVSGNTLVIEYLRNTPWTDSTGVTYKTVATVDTDITVIPQELLELDLKWRFEKAKGLDYTEDYQEAQQLIDVAFAQDAPGPTIDYGMMTNPTPNFLANIPQTITP